MPSPVLVESLFGCGGVVLRLMPAYTTATAQSAPSQLLNKDMYDITRRRRRHELYLSADTSSVLRILNIKEQTFNKKDRGAVARVEASRVFQIEGPLVYI